MAGLLQQVFDIVLPKRKPNPRGVAQTPTFREAATDRPLPAPAYRDHLRDLFTERLAQDSRALLKDLFKHDPDASAAVNAYLTVADTDPWFVVRDPDGRIARDGHKLLDQVLVALFNRSDYATAGFLHKPTLRALCADLRYLALLRGGIGAELVVDAALLPAELRVVDLASVQWLERQPGRYVPVQVPAGASRTISLDLPSFAVAFYRRDPTEIYTHSPFVSSVNIIAARQQVINDLYRILRLTGYPRLDVTVLEEVLRKNAPADARGNETVMRQYLQARLQEIASAVSNIRPDQAFVHLDSTAARVINDKNPAAGLNISQVVDTLNAQNQAALKTMATVIGRGEMGVNTASVEASVFAKNAGQLNQPVADLLAYHLTFALRLHGFPGTVEVGFDPVELRPDLELEAQKTMRQSRLLELLSVGLIDDDTFHLEMFSRIRPDHIPERSGTGFFQGGGRIDAAQASPNGDPLGRALTPGGAKSARSKTVKKTQAAPE